MKVEAEREIIVLESKISELQVSKISISEVEKTVDSAISKLTAVNSIFSESDHYARRKLIGSIYSEKFTIEDLKVRTAKRNEAFELICLINNQLKGNKKGTNQNFSCLSQGVNPIGFESN